MSTARIARLLAVSVLVFFALDLIWLGVVADEFYARHMGALMAEEVRWLPAIVFYLLFVCGIVAFVTSRAIEHGSGKFAVLGGALFGLVTYATFDLTSLALIRDFPEAIVIPDLIWGMVLTATVAWAGYAVDRRLAVHDAERQAP